jgi:hypothetical protein
MSESASDGDREDKPIIIDISLREQIRKERIVAIVFVLMVAGLAYLMYVNIR